MRDLSKLREGLTKIRVDSDTPVEKNWKDNWVEEMLKEEAAASQQVSTPGTSNASAPPAETTPGANAPAPQAPTETSPEPNAPQPPTPVVDECSTAQPATAVPETNDVTAPARTTTPTAPVKFIAPGEYEDPNTTIQGRAEEVFDMPINRWGKKQRSVRVRKPDGSTVLVSAFGKNITVLDTVKLGCTYEFSGRLKENKGSVYLNLK